MNGLGGFDSRVNLVFEFMFRFIGLAGVFSFNVSFLHGRLLLILLGFGSFVDRFLGFRDLFFSFLNYLNSLLACDLAILLVNDRLVGFFHSFMSLLNLLLLGFNGFLGFFVS